MSTVTLAKDEGEGLRREELEDEEDNMDHDQERVRHTVPAASFKWLQPSCLSLSKRILVFPEQFLSCAATPPSHSRTFHHPSRNPYLMNSLSHPFLVHLLTLDWLLCTLAGMESHMKWPLVSGSLTDNISDVPPLFFLFFFRLV